MRVLFIAGYTHAAYHRKIEVLANAPEVDLLHVTVEGYGRATGEYASADGQRHYRVQTYPAHSLGSAGDPHRSFLWPPHYAMSAFRPHLVQAESDVETLGTAQVALARRIWAPSSRLIEFSWQNLLRPRPWWVRQLSRWTFGAADHIICASAEAVEVLRRQGYRRPASIMPLVGIDTRYFYPRPVPELKAKLGLTLPVIGFVGRLSPEKGVDVLLRACAQLARPVQIVVVGDGSARAELEALGRELQLAGRCRFVGQVAYDDLGQYLNALDVMVLPSRTTPQWKEQFGRVLVEAMACQVTVIGSDSGAIPEVIGEAGRIFPEGDVAALARLIDEMVANAALRQALRESGYRRAMERYAVDRLAQDTLAIWRSLVRQ